MKKFDGELRLPFIHPLPPLTPTSSLPPPPSHYDHLRLCARAQAPCASLVFAYERVSVLATVQEPDLHQGVRSDYPRPVRSRKASPSGSNSEFGSESLRPQNQQGCQDCCPVQGDCEEWRDQERRKPTRSRRRLGLSSGKSIAIYETARPLIWS